MHQHTKAPYLAGTSRNSGRRPQSRVICFADTSRNAGRRLQSGAIRTQKYEVTAVDLYHGVFAVRGQRRPATDSFDAEELGDDDDEVNNDHRYVVCLASSSCPQRSHCKHVLALLIFAITELGMAVMWPDYETLTVTAMDDGTLHSIVSNTEFVGALSTAQELRLQAQQQAPVRATLREPAAADHARTQLRQLADLSREAARHASELSALPLVLLHAAAPHLAAASQGVAGSHTTHQGLLSVLSEPDTSCCSDDDLRSTALLLLSALRTDAPATIVSA